MDQTYITPYHLQSKGVVERNNRLLVDLLRTLLMRRGKGEWDTLLLQIMRAFRGTPNTNTQETASYLLVGRELRLHDQLLNLPSPVDKCINDSIIEYKKD